MEKIKLFDLTLETAKVVDINDPKKEGKIQINIESKFDNFEKKLLPWAIPLISNVADGTMEMHLPKINSQVWILVDKYYKRFYYLSNRYFYNLFDFSRVGGLLDKCNKINKDYKNISFKYYEDGTLIFHNNSDGSTGIINKKGTIVYVNENGDLVKEVNSDEIVNIKNNKKETIKNTFNQETKDTSIKCSNKYKIDSKNVEVMTDNNIVLKSKTVGTVEMGNNTVTLGSILLELCQDLAGLVTTGSSSTHTSPKLASQMFSLISKIKKTFK